MTFLQFLIDDMCANFTVEVMSKLVKRRLTLGPCTISDLAGEVANTDRTLDIKSAQILAQAAVESLAESGDIVIQDPLISLTAREPEAAASKSPAQT